MANYIYMFLIHTFALYCTSHLTLCFSFQQTRTSQSSLGTADKKWGGAGATWYGGAHGDGSTGGACGYGNAVGNYPFSSKIAAGSPSLFKAGKGCGACYQVRCTRNRACSQKPVTVVITDECPGGPCLYESVHFDLSGTAFGAMAIPGCSDKLRAVGTLPIQYKRVPCEYPHKTIAFHVDSGSNPNYLSVLIEFADGDGNLAGVELKESSSTSRLRAGSALWRPMRLSWGALWRLNSGPELKAPFSIRLTSQNLHRKVVAENVIPAGWRPGATYRSLVNFN